MQRSENETVPDNQIIPAFRTIIHFRFQNGTKEQKLYKLHYQIPLE
jgi:hypothetical protein